MLFRPEFLNAAQPSCLDLFLNSQLPLIALSPSYRGEDRGEYLDPISKRPWQVVYFKESEKEPFQVYIRDGRLVDKNGNLVSTNFDSENLFIDSGLFIIDRDYRLYLLPFEQRGKFHHSSLAGGEAVRFAGTIAVMNGVLREVSNQSGHYKPTGPQTLKGLRWLESQGISLRQTNLTGAAAHFFSGTYKMTYAEFAPLLLRE